jgi:PAS domain S-box-containing protein
MENEFRRVVDAIPGLVWTALPDGYADFINQRWSDYTGLSIDEASGWGWHSAIHPDDMSQVLGAWRTILDSGKSREVEARLRRFDGEYRWFVFHACPLTDASGKIVKWGGINTDIEDRKQAEEALRASERRFRLIVDGLPTHVALSNAQCEFERANRCYMDYFGGTLEELKARGPVHSCHPDDRPAVIAARREAVATGRPYEIEARRLGADGLYRWFHMRHFPLRDEEGRIALWYLLQTDIDDRKRAEALLAGEKELLERVASGGSIRGALDALCRLVEESAGGCHCSIVLVDPKGMHLEYVVAPSLPPGFIDSINGRSVNVDSGPCAMAVFLNEQVIAADLASETRWEQYAWAPMALAHGLRACWSTPFSSAAGKVLGAFALYFEEPKTPTPLHQSLIERFTHLASIAVERVQSDTTLRRSEAILAQAQHLSSTASFYWRVATDEITWSEEAYRLFEFDRALPITNELVFSRIHPEDSAQLFEMMDRARRGELVEMAYEHRLLMPDNSVKYVNMVFSGARDQDGQLEYIAAVQDITPRRVSEEELGKARSELARVARASTLGALTASIAHEVNQPLSGIIINAGTCVRMLAGDPPNIDGARETAQRTIRDGNRAGAVIARLRALFAKTEPAIEALDLNDAAREVIALLRSELQRSRVVLRLDFAADLPPVAGDRVQLQQVILNLVLNAADAMSAVDDRLRQLAIKTERDGVGQVCLRVQDAGVGIETQSAEKLFEAFYTTKSGGMGIGLSVSRSIIESHHGHLWASPNEGPGATFAFALPRNFDSDATSLVSIGA